MCIFWSIVAPADKAEVIAGHGVAKLLRVVHIVCYDVIDDVLFAIFGGLIAFLLSVLAL